MNKVSISMGRIIIVIIVKTTKAARTDDSLWTERNTPTAWTVSPLGLMWWRWRKLR